jgi:hypothetical protein
LVIYLYDQHNRIWKKWPLVPTYIEIAYDPAQEQVVVKFFGFPNANFMEKYTEGLDVDCTSALSLATSMRMFLLDCAVTHGVLDEVEEQENSDDGMSDAGHDDDGMSEAREFMNSSPSTPNTNRTTNSPSSTRATPPSQGRPRSTPVLPLEPRASKYVVSIVSLSRLL